MQVMELGQKKINEQQQQRAAQEAARQAAALRKPVDPKEALIDELIAQARWLRG